MAAAAARSLTQREQDIQMMLSADVHLGTKNCDFQMERYVFKRRTDDVGAEESSPKKRAKKDKDQKARRGGSGLHKKKSLGEKQEKESKDRKKGKKHGDFTNDRHFESPPEKNSLVPSKPSKRATNVLRKRVDPETAKYFLEIANLFESNAVDLEERSTICANALEETKGKELELSTDGVISRTLQNLVESCDLDQLCGFISNCVESFPIIAMDKFGSHVAEAALKSLATHLEDESSRSYVEDILNKICKVVAADAVNVMHSCYGSHVLRTLLCLCKGVPLETLQDFHVTKTSAVLAERFSSGLDQSVGQDQKNFEHGFTHMFRHFVRELLNYAKYEIAALRVDKYSSLVLQTALKLSAGNDQELLHIISSLLGFNEKNVLQEKPGAGRKQEMMVLLEHTASSHLLEVIMQVAPEELRNDMLKEIFKGALFEISSHHCGNFVVQALIASARAKDQMNQIWEELGSKIKELLELGKPGVVASILAACQRLQINRLECCQALAVAVSLDSEAPDCIVPHILFLESFLRDKSSWEWPLGEKMSVLGCLMLQNIFKCPHQYIRPYVASLLSMSDDQIIQISKDSGGSRVLEAFLCSSVAAKRKFKVFAKLQGHYGEIAMKPSSSFLIEKCFSASNFSHKEAMVVELVAARAELSRTRHGLHLLRKLDVDGYARRPEQWRSSQTSKETAQKEFQAEFGLAGKNEHASSHGSSKKKHKRNKSTDDSDQGRDASFPVPKNKPDQKRQKSSKATAGNETDSNKFVRNTSNMPFLSSCNKRKSPGFPAEKQSTKRQKSNKPTTDLDNKKFVTNSDNQESSMSELADLASKGTLTAGEVRKLFASETRSKK